MNVWQKLSLPIILLVTFLVFSPTLQNDFTNWDDRHYIQDNDYIKSLNTESIVQLFKAETIVSSNYHPLTLLTLSINYHFSELNAQPYILTNIILHILSVLLVFYFIFLLSKRKWWVSALVATLFAIHPMHVESVAWIAERKDVLYAFFFSGALITYLKYQNKRNYLYYGLTLLLFFLSILSKSAAAPFPFVLLLLDFYRGNFPSKQHKLRLLLEKIPFLAIAIYIGLLAVNTQSDAIGVLEKYGILDRFAIASHGLIIYVVKLFVPFKLSAFYPRPAASAIPIFHYISIGIVLLSAAATIYSLRYSRRWFFGMLFFFLMIALVLQFITVGGAAYADRYTYVPYIGLFYLICMEANKWLTSSLSARHHHYALWAGIGIVLTCFAIMSHNRTYVWKDSGTLWSDVIDKYPSAARAYLNRGEYLHEEKKYEAAIADYNMKIKMEPYSPDAYMNKGMSLFQLGRYKEAIASQDEAIRRKADYAEAYRNRGNAYYSLQQYDKALTDYNSTLKYNPKDARAYNNIANIQFMRGQSQAAIEAYTKAINLSPDNYYAWGNRGSVYRQIGRMDQARKDLIQSLSINNQNGGFWYTLSQVHLALGDRKQASMAADKAKNLGTGIPQDFLNKLNGN
jgi:tetratricopeptide (TPR) repeat protein